MLRHVYVHYVILHVCSSFLMLKIRLYALWYTWCFCHAFVIPLLSSLHVQPCVVWTCHSVWWISSVFLCSHTDRETDGQSNSPETFDSDTKNSTLNIVVLHKIRASYLRLSQPNKSLCNGKYGPANCFAKWGNISKVQMTNRHMCRNLFVWSILVSDLHSQPH